VNAMPLPADELRSELQTAIGAIKCWRCGCFQDAVVAFENSPEVQSLLGPMLDEAHRLFQGKRYDCLGCDQCWPAVAINAAAQIDPAVAEAGHCPTEEPELREGWPPLPGDYRVLRYQAPVAVCTLNSDELVASLAETRAADIAIVGSLHTENLGIEHLIRNVLANPYIRFLIVCGEDTCQSVGHLPGQSLVSLLTDSFDENMRIHNAQGKRAVVKNLSKEQVEAFRRQIQVIDRIGETAIETILDYVAEAVVRSPGPVFEAISDTSPIKVVQALEPARLVSDHMGYVVIYPDRRREQLMLEHYTNKGVLDRVFEGTSATALYSTVIEAELISRLDHAAYLGRELARAEQALLAHSEYVQDRAPGELEETSSESSC
jgi:tetrahydromethanopterin S-methyltransferase subunit A